MFKIYKGDIKIEEWNFKYRKNSAANPSVLFILSCHESRVWI